MKAVAVFSDRGNSHSRLIEVGGVSDFARAEMTWPGWLNKLLTHPVSGLENYQKLLEALTHGEGVIKAYCEISK